MPLVGQTFPVPLRVVLFKLGTSKTRKGTPSASASLRHTRKVRTKKPAGLGSLAFEGGPNPKTGHVVDRRRERDRAWKMPAPEAADDIRDEGVRRRMGACSQQSVGHEEDSKPDVKEQHLA